MCTTGGESKFRRLYNRGSSVKVTYDSEVLAQEDSDSAVYDEHDDWENINSVVHQGDGVLDRKGSEKCSGKEGPTNELLYISIFALETYLLHAHNRWHNQG
jgi:hypothetical protein